METQTPYRAEHFIPYLRDDLVGMCLSEGRLDESDKEIFREICGFLVDYLHCHYLQDIEAIKRHYAPFDPDRETLLRKNGARSPEEGAEKLADIFSRLATDANYYPIESDTIRECFDRVTLIKLQTQVDLDDFERVLCFARGDVFQEVSKRRLFRNRPLKVDVLERVLLFLKFKDESHFRKAGRKQLPQLQPGKIYLYYYKDVPKWDLELLFPNVKVGMRLKDKLMFSVPALGGGIGVIVKILPQLLLLVGTVLLFFGARSWAEGVGVNEETTSRVMPVLTAAMGVTMALGGLAAKQWTSYQKKRIEFLREVAEQLFYRNLATNRSVFHRVIDSAEEEESKEMILVLYHLLVGRDGPPTRSELDRSIEAWMREQFGTVIDFDIDGALRGLGKLRGTLPGGREVVLLAEFDGRLQVAAPADALALLETLAARRFRV